MPGTVVHASAMQGRAATCVLREGSFCTCDMDDNSGHMDLSAISKSDGTPFFKDIKGASNWKYSYNPCSPFVDNKCKADVLVCQGGDSVCGRDTSVNIEVTDTAPVGGTIKYGNGDVLSKVPRTAVVTFTCDASVESDITFVKEDPAGNYQFKLVSKHTCVIPPTTQAPPPPGTTAPQPPGPTGPHHRTSEKNSISMGSILSISFFTIALMYLSGGIAFMMIRNGERGRETIPNYAFWVALPGLIKEGFLFIVHGFKSSGYRSGYDQI
ncbi:uncharacterized protein LOC135812184 [Sycon ciliatum]|uniref:uncharacterized protein LOC135812184 n=1 Tax=Sycon ciliatum TaxID=27933 RepID=UPI0031F71AC2